MSRNSTSRAVVLAFLIGALAWVIAFEAAKRWGSGAGYEPLTPVDAREQGSLQAMTLPTGGEAPATWKISDQRGGVVVVNFFATWCPPCREEEPELIRLARQFGPRGVTFVAVSFDQDNEQGPGVTREQALRQYLASVHPPFPLLVPALDSPLLNPALNQSVALPQTFLYDRQGRIARQINGSILGRDLQRSLEELLKE